MLLNIKLFGVVKEKIGSDTLVFEASSQASLTVAELLEQLKGAYPVLGSLSSLAVAVNHTYASGEVALQAQDEIALIPPVSGG